ncbi:MAG: lipopolysaccharide biosynthesis protein [Chloroflexi bacterium]|nr:MAG: lipopolysaccharide biosynthesis protein [Chloroflexota bacterium]
MTLAARAIAFYLPQFHPIPENETWWGPGFTEWSNVVSARPLFRGHRQPNLPADLGFYDLRVAETREQQAQLAAAHGIEAFCYWHYWFAGRQLLERPFEEVLRLGRPDFPFCLGWANQTWSGVWHGAPERVLIEQTYPGEDDDRRHFAALLPAFNDARYLCVDGKALFYVFRPEQLPDPRTFTARWHRMAKEAGLPGIYLVAEVSDLLGRGPVFGDPRDAGFDAGVYMRLPAENHTRAARTRMRFGRKVLRRPEVYAYARHAPPAPDLAVRAQLMPCVYPNWDNTPRSGRRGLVLTGSQPARFGVHVREAVATLQSRSATERLLFIKSWNEWAEGNYLEPDRRFGTAYLDVLRAELGAQPARAADAEAASGRSSAMAYTLDTR